MEPISQQVIGDQRFAVPKFRGVTLSFGRILSPTSFNGIYFKLFGKILDKQEITVAGLSMGLQ